MTPLGARISLKGMISSKVRRTEQYFAFEMQLGGTQKSSPVGCPTPSDSVEYTVFLPLNPGELANLQSAPKDQIWVVVGDISLDIPVNECPGDIGVIAFQISAAKAPEEKESQREEKSKNSIPQEKPHIVAVKEKPVVAAPSIRVNSLPIDNINLPELYRDAWLNPEKTQPVREWIQRHGRLDKPVEVTFKNDEYWLADGYRRFAIARDLGFSEVPVRVVQS